MRQHGAVLIAAPAQLSRARDRANIAVKYEDLKQTQPFQTTSKNKRKLAFHVYYVAAALVSGPSLCFVCAHNPASFTH